jgi:membrane protease YdiL (CAAX protease family)
MLALSPGTRAIPVGMVVALQLLQGLLLGPIINIFVTMGEELGWRGFLLPRLLPLGQWRAILLSGLVWGIWHAPVILQGYNYPQHPVWGVLLMTVSTVLLAVIFSWLYLATRSPWVAALAHASLNAWGGLPLLFLAAGFDTAYGGTIISITGWVVMGVVIGILVLTKQLPVKLPVELAPASAPVPVAD